MYGAPVPNVAGPTPILVDVATSTSALITPGSSGTFNHYLAFLGWTEGVPELADDAYWSDVYCDDNGGVQGPPTDIQYMGETCDIRLTLSKYDANVAAMITARGYGNLSGVPMAPGVLMIAQWLFYRVVVNSPMAPTNFPCVVFRKAMEIGKGTKYSQLRLIGTAYKAPGNHPIAEYRSILSNADVGDNNWTIPGFGGHT